MIEQGVRDVFSSDNFRNYLSFLSKFHTYSLNNMILIMSQYPEATLVAGYSSWSKNFNRHVNKGERAIKILAPYEYSDSVLVDKSDENGIAVLDKDGNVEQKEKERKMIGFMVVNVFDVAQTSGEPLPELDTHELTGSGIEIKALIESIREICDIPIEFKETESDSILRNGAKGYYDKSKDRIVVSSSMDDKQIVKTLAHEYSHSRLHKETDKPQFQREVEAESLAYVICDHFGIDTSDYSFTYVAAYASEHPEELKQILLDIHASAHEIIEKIDPIFEEKLIELNKDIQYEPPVGEAIEGSRERANYERLEAFAKPVLMGDAYYMKLSSPGMMDLHVERIIDDRIAVSHYYKQNGDMMADPDMEFTVDKENRLLMAYSYQQDNLCYYCMASDGKQTADDLNYFASDWLENIANNRYRISEIDIEGKEMNSEDNYKELKEFCGRYGMKRMVEKRKEEIER